MKSALILALPVLSGALLAATAPVEGPLPPARALAAFETTPGLKVDLAAAEPLVESPCALAWDEAGRLYVAENRGYPTGSPDGQPLGRITRLEDPDGDGRYDQATVFAEGLTFPNGLMPWRGGLIVTCAPDVLWLRDADGDGRADQREVWLTGFATNQSTQLRVNKPMLAPDGWIYLASGLSGGRITNPRQPDQPALELKGDLRFDPDTGRFESIDGRSQFGQSFDDFGRRFGVHNRVQVQHFVLPSVYLARNPDVASPGTVENCPELVDNPWLKAGGGAARLFPISANVTTADSHAGTFSAACAVHVWRGGLLPTNHLGGVFSCDPTANLVHFDRLEPRGATFAARGATNGTEILRSPDSWFRPVYLATGPDGALYVADLYRRTIEHPDYLPEAVRARTDFRSGRDQGRIWRISSAKAPARASRPNRTSRNRREAPTAGIRFPGDAPGWVAELASANSWRRDTAFRLLRETRPANAFALLDRAVTNQVAGFTVVPALTLLDGADLLPDRTLLSGLYHPEAGVREYALRLAEKRLRTSPALLPAVLELAGDEDARVRFQAALALGFATPERADVVLPALARVAMLDGRDRWARAAILSSMNGYERAFLAVLLRQPNTPGDPVVPMLSEYAAQLGRSVEPEDRGEVLNALFSQPAFNLERTLAFMAGYGDGLRTAGATFAASLTNASGASLGRFRLLTDMARNLAGGTNTEPSLRLQAVRVLGLDTNAASLPVLARLLDDAPPPLPDAALEALARREEPEAARLLFGAPRWNRFTPGQRATLLGRAGASPILQLALLDAVQRGDLPATAIDPTTREMLRKSPRPEVRTQAETLFQKVTPADRQKALGEARAALALAGQPAAGREVFKRLCAACHRLDREGVAVGPDLFGIRNQSKEAILLHLVIPDLEVAPQFLAYECETRDGRIRSGLLMGETTTTVTLRQAQGVEEIIPRSQIVRLAASPSSLMPQGLESSMTSQELADLLAFLRGQ